MFSYEQVLQHFTVVCQGSLGDCWFLSALAVMGSQQDLLFTCFYHLDMYQEFGLFVCRFFKDNSVMYVIVDDKIPVFAANNKVVFGRCQDPNELWVSLLEKAYAKLHGSYKGIIGGYVHLALADLTGYSPLSLVLKQGYVGFSQLYSPEEIWQLLTRYKQWGCLMGCSVQPAPKPVGGGGGGGGAKEEEVGGGLYSGHAYSLLDIGEITTEDVDGESSCLSSSGQQQQGQQRRRRRLVKLRNPWGRGEWDGPFGDRSDQRAKYDAIISEVK